jgi:hypothetical protein
MWEVRKLLPARQENGAQAYTKHVLLKTKYCMYEQVKIKGYISSFAQRRQFDDKRRNDVAQSTGINHVAYRRTSRT